MIARVIAVKRQMTWALVGALCWIVLPSFALAWSDPLSKEERLGRTIYHRGEAEGTEEIRAQVSGAREFLPATLFRCAQCHGVRGEGTQEGGLRVPSLTPFALRHATDSSQTGHHRAPYTTETLARAIRDGLDASGRPLHLSMPRYRMTPVQMAAVVAYLTQVGEEVDADPGITATTISVGTVLPLSGPLAQIGEDVRTILSGALSRVNERGGVYGRQLRLVVEDSAGDPERTAAATARLIEQQQVFALLGSFLPSGDSALPQLLQHRQVPLIGPLVLSPRLSDPPHPSMFYSLPGFGLQFRALVDFVAGRAVELTGTARPALAVIHAEGSENAEALQAVRRQAVHDGLAIVVDQEFQPGRLDGEPLVTQLRLRGIDALVFLGDGQDLSALGTELDRQGAAPLLLSAVNMVGPRVRTLPASLLPRVLLTASLPPPTQRDLDQVMALAGLDRISSVGFGRMAHIAASMLVEALMRAGRQLNRTTLIEALESFRDQEAGQGDGLTFGPQRRLGTFRSLVLGWAPDAPHLVPVSGWILPAGDP